MKPHYKILAMLCLIGGIGLAESQKGEGKADAIFHRADKNGDGKVTKDELPNEETFAKFDLNNDGIITLEEGRQVLDKIVPSAEAAPTETSPPERIFDY